MATRQFPYIDRTNELLFRNYEIITDNEEEESSAIIAHGLVLFYASERLKELVKGANNNQIFVSGVSKPTLEMLIDYLYASFTENPSPITISEDSIYDLSVASKYLGLEDVVETLQAFIDLREPTVENCVSFLKSAYTLRDDERGDHRQLFWKNLKFVISNICNVSLTLPFKSLDIFWIQRILEYGRGTEEVTQKDLSTITVNWIQHGQQLSYMDDLLKEFEDRDSQFAVIAAFFETASTDEDKKAALYKLGGLYVEDDGKIKTEPKIKIEPKIEIKTEDPCGSPSSSGYSTNPLEEEESDSLISSPPPPKRRKRKTSDSVWNNSGMDEKDDDNMQNTSTNLKSQSPLFSQNIQPVVIRTRSLATSSYDIKTAPSPEGIIYFLWGEFQSTIGRQLYKYNLNNQQCSLVTKVPGDYEELRFRRKLSLLYWKDEIYFMGGEAADTGKVTRKVVIFNLKSKLWRDQKMKDKRYDFQSVVLDGHIYAIGGAEEDERGPEVPGVVINTVECLPPKVPGKTQKWKPAGDFMINARSEAGIVTLYDKIYAIGGLVKCEDSDDEEVESSRLCEEFDPKLPTDNQFNSMASLNVPRLGLAAVATNDKIYALGGRSSREDSEKDNLKEVEIYDPLTKSWTLGPNLIKGRSNFSAGFYDGHIYAFGGDGNGIPTVEKLNLLTNQWTMVGPIKLNADLSSVAFL